MHHSPLPAAVVPDAQLIAASVSDAAMFAEVFRRHATQVDRYLARRVERSMVEDLVAETFTLAFDQRRSYRAEYPDARPWLFGIATNLTRHHQRSERTRQSAYARLGADQTYEGVEAAAVARADARARREELAEALGRLHPGDHDALLLLVWAELSYAEIAEALEIPIGTVRSRINRARRRLRELLDRVPASSV